MKRSDKKCACVGVKAGTAAMLLLAAALPAGAETTLSLNLDYAEGKYGEPEKSYAWTMPLIVRHRTGALGLRLYVPYIRATGTAAAGGDRGTFVRQTQEGLGDVVTTVTYDIYGTPGAGPVVSLGAKAKLAPPGETKDLITTGKNDYSLLLDLGLPTGPVTWYGSIGHTKKGDPEDVDFRNPWFSSMGFRHRLSDQTTWGLNYDYRQRLTPFGDPVREATLFFEHRLDSRYKIDVYVLRGYSDASPDLAVGATLSTRF
jgi:hypothetical protein